MDDRTRQQHRHEPPPPPGAPGDLSLTTLAIAAAASAAAAFVTSQVWAGGTLWSAAMTPIIVAFVREGLKRPVERVRTVRTTRSGQVIEESVVQDLPPRTGEMAPVTVYRSSGESRWSSRHIRIAILTGLLAFVVVVAAYTVPELVAGKSFGGGGDHRTTLFGGAPEKSSSKKDDDEPAPAATAEPGTTAEPQATEAPEETVTAVPTPTATATATATPPPAAEPPAPTP